ncbi:hypothetical protein [Deinococcus cellulosilyticus]|uniref:Uncharacterized protein n=1 Tax=Deinococcus cellulosilyticus (strain DSM 18568 / NBRC 106333 / KACC 11606 / 5516J-15) TaxID=1223518 RepID=A0A511N8P8_DEIC1|nr:hypothetical protein [Deinococcus cellulosilyticus]GEM49219.1 hypothetical protein DC3_48540 [Deinococcus cellulosilyticus NBRC 106333 = KACC 11606]
MADELNFTDVEVAPRAIKSYTLQWHYPTNTHQISVQLEDSSWHLLTVNDPLEFIAITTMLQKGPVYLSSSGLLEYRGDVPQE